MSFHDVLTGWPEATLRGLFDAARLCDAERALAREERDVGDLVALLSPAARPLLESMAREAQRLTRWHFGRTISLYVPLYISNVCGADCTYCGFASGSGIKRERLNLSPEEIRRECEALAGQGFQNVLVLTGEAPKAVSAEDLARAVGIAREYFASVSVEVYSLEEEEYGLLCRHGLEGVTLYMETYDASTYRAVHLKGRKRDYRWRLDAIERAGRAGARRLSVGALLGLYDWRMDAVWMALHARYLQKQCWRSAVSLSFPRLHDAPSRFSVAYPLSDADLVQITLALRLFLPEAGFNLSTRESAELRDGLLPLGITSMSAGSSTRPGGYATTGEEVLEQFEVADRRTPSEVAAAIRRAGYDPVWKDYDHAFDAV